MTLSQTSVPYARNGALCDETVALDARLATATSVTVAASYARAGGCPRCAAALTFAGRFDGCDHWRCVSCWLSVTPLGGTFTERPIAWPLQAGAAAGERAA